MRRGRFIYLFLTFLICFGAILFGVSRIQERMNRIREERELTNTQILENAPPVVAFTTIALGAFRGLVADWLWLRSNKMKEEGKYFEMVQLASWIVKLQPRFTGAATYLAWNMAYNVSVTFTEFDARWRWVQSGIEIIRDEAMLYNAGDPRLYHELGWIYQHKIGQTLDDAHKYYKMQLADQITTAVGEYPPDWSELAAAPETKQALLERLEAPGKLKQILDEQDMTLRELEKRFRKQAGFADNVAAALEKDELKKPVEVFFRSRWLREVYKLKPKVIVEINDKYGDLDWRLPEAHAVYWGIRGREVELKGRGSKQARRKWARLIYQGLQQAFRQGRLVATENLQHFQTTPNIYIVDAVNQAHIETAEKYDVSILGGYKNFVVDAVVILYTFGAEDKAREYLQKGRDKWPDDKTFKRGLREFVLDELSGDVQGRPSQVRAAVQSYLLQSCRALAYGDIDRASAFERIADGIWRRWRRTGAAAGDADARQGLPPYEEMTKNAVRLALQRFPDVLQKNLREALPEIESLEQGQPPQSPSD